MSKNDEGTTIRDPPQLSLSSLIAILSVIAVLLGIGVNVSDDRSRLSVWTSPFFVGLWVLWLLFRSRKRLATAFLVLHSLVA